MEPEIQLEEQPEETIGQVKDGQVVLNEGVEDTSTTQMPELPPEKLRELGQKMAEVAVEFFGEVIASQLAEKDTEIEALEQMITLKNSLGEVSSSKGKQKEEESSKKSVETDTKHKAELKAKSTEIAILKKMMKQKEKEVKDLFNQVKEALSDAE